MDLATLGLWRRLAIWLHLRLDRRGPTRRAQAFFRPSVEIIRGIKRKSSGFAVDRATTDNCELGEPFGRTWLAPAFPNILSGGGAAKIARGGCGQLASPVVCPVFPAVDGDVLGTGCGHEKRATKIPTDDYFVGFARRYASRMLFLIVSMDGGA